MYRLRYLLCGFIFVLLESSPGSAEIRQHDGFSNNNMASDTVVANWLSELEGYYEVNKQQIFRIKKTENSLFAHSPVGEEYYPLNFVEKDLYEAKTGEKYTFNRSFDDRLPSLTWCWKDQCLEARKANPYDVEEVRITNGDVTLAGSYYKPNREGKHPGVVIINGGGPVDRNNLKLEAELFAAYGLAVLLYDKRGAGSSGGDFYGTSTWPTFEELLYDALGVLDFLINRPEVNEQQVGIWGTSQGGRIGIMAAAQKSEVAWLICNATPVTTLQEGQVYAYEHFSRQQNIQEKTIQKIVDIWGRYYDQLYQKKVKANLIQEIRDLQRSSDTRLPLPPATSNLNVGIPWENIKSSPVPFLKKLDIPVFMLWGDEDKRVPGRLSWKRADSVLSERDMEVDHYFFPKANHSFYIESEGRIAPGYFMKQLCWILERVDTGDIKKKYYFGNHD
ncbi:MAG: alpha/beta hydrolase [Balneolaceae bacterium]|nr:alpha/beta hydrolase [Balneolaceae bacterium]